MKIRRLSDVERKPPLTIFLDPLPIRIRMTSYAMEKAFAISRIIRECFRENYEWYGFTIGTTKDPETVHDLGIARDAMNLEQYTRLEAQDILHFTDQLYPNGIINGWIHSHGSLSYHHFSPTDDHNHRTVLDSIGARLRRPVFKKEVRIDNVNLCVEGSSDPNRWTRGSVTILTDSPVNHVRLLETYYGTFCYAVVIGDEGWMDQRIITKTRGILTGRTRYEYGDAEVEIIKGSFRWSIEAEQLLRDEIRRKIHPPASELPPRLDRL